MHTINEIHTHTYIDACLVAMCKYAYVYLVGTWLQPNKAAVQSFEKSKKKKLKI